MNPVLIRLENDSAFAIAKPVGAEGSIPMPHARIGANHTVTPEGAAAGFWECTPGRFRRQVPQAEYSYFLSGEGNFTPDGAEPVEFRAGDAIYFAANTEGEWHIRKTVRKAYLILP